jgi:hypothetical protein
MNEKQHFEHLRNEFISKSEQFIEGVRQIEFEQLYDAESKFKIAALRNDAVKSYANMLEFILEMKR